MREHSRLAKQGRWPLLSMVTLVLLAGAAFSASCAGKKVASKAAPEAQKYRLQSIVVMPFETLATPQVERQDVEQPPVPEGALKSDIEMVPGVAGQRAQQPTAAVPPEAGMKVAQIFSRRLRQKKDLEVFSPLIAEGELKRVARPADTLTREEAGQKVAVRLEADAALVGLVRVYRERVGSKYGAEPASVGFEVKLVAGDGRTIWAGNYYEQQRPVTEDIGGFLDRGIGFVKAEDLANYGAEKLIAQFPF